jgi:hypothetical protein
MKLYRFNTEGVKKTKSREALRGRETGAGSRGNTDRCAGLLRNEPLRSLRSCSSIAETATLFPLLQAREGIQGGELPPPKTGVLVL